MAYVSMKQMLETGVHFGHQTRRWNPKMRPYIFGARNGIHIIDLQQTVKLFRTAYDKMVDTVARGGKILFIGTKRQAQEAVAAEAERAGQYHVTNRWMGGTLTNFSTIQKSVERLPQLAFIIDPHREEIAVKECRKLGIPIVAITDTNCDPDVIDYVIPGNDDAIRAIKLFVTAFAEACMEGDAMTKDDNVDAEEALKRAAQAEAAAMEPRSAEEGAPE